MLHITPSVGPVARRWQAASLRRVTSRLNRANIISMTLQSTSWRTLVRLIPTATARWSLVLGVGLIAGLLSAGHYLAFTNIPTTDAVIGMVIVKVLVWLLWIPFVLATLEIAHRWPLTSHQLVRRLGILFAGKVVVLIVYLSAYALLLYVMARGRSRCRTRRGSSCSTTAPISCSPSGRSSWSKTH